MFEHADRDDQIEGTARRRIERGDVHAQPRQLRLRSVEQRRGAAPHVGEEAEADAAWIEGGDVEAFCAQRQRQQARAGADFQNAVTGPEIRPNDVETVARLVEENAEALPRDGFRDAPIRREGGG